MQIEAHWLNKTNMAKSLGISPQAFSAWGVEPVAKIGRQNFYTAADVLDNRVAYWLEKSGGDDDDIGELKTEYLKARTRLTREQAVAQEMKNEMMKHEVAPFALFTFVLGKTANVIAGVMDGLPTELMRKLNLKPQEAEKVKALVSVAADSIADLGDEDWLGGRFDEFLNQEEMS